MSLHIPISNITPQSFDTIPITAFAGLIALSMVLIAGRPAIRLLARFCREPNFSNSKKLEALHAHKDRTPTMGGLLILAAIATTSLLFAEITTPAFLLGAVVLVGFGIIGLLDDSFKLHTGRKGLSAKTKLLAQLAVATIAAVLLYRTTDTGLHIPLIGDTIPIDRWYIPLAVFIITGSSNAVNLTDGLDGLAAGCLACCFGAMTLFALFITHTTTPSIAVMLAATTGAVIGFWRFNRYPARVFMGDVGSLPLGALLGLFALLTGLELVLAVLGIIFVAEALSVIIQVGAFKLKKRRVFLCAPLHHHFQFLGWSETTIVRRFHLVAFAGAVVAVMLSLL